MVVESAYCRVAISIYLRAGWHPPGFKHRCCVGQQPSVSVSQIIASSATCLLDWMRLLASWLLMQKHFRNLKISNLPPNREHKCQVKTSSKSSRKKVKIIIHANRESTGGQTLRNSLSEHFH